MEKIRKHYKYGNKTLLLFILSVLSGMIIFGALYYFIFRHKKNIDLAGEILIEAPVTAAYTAIEFNQRFIQEGFLNQYIDSIKNDVIHFTVRNKQYVSKKADLNEFESITQVVINPEKKIILTVGWYFTPVNDTLTKVRLHVKGHIPLVHGFINPKDRHKQMISEVLKYLKKFVENQKNQITYRTCPEYLAFGPLPYLHREFPYDNKFYETFNRNFSELLIYAISRKVYDKSQKSFLLIYNAPTGNRLNFYKYRNAVPVTHLPEEKKEAISTDTLHPQKYFCVSANQNYSFLTYNIYRARQLIPDSVPLDFRKPVMIRFVKGHSYSSDPEQWVTQYLFPVKP